MNVALDHHYSSAIAAQLRDMGHDVWTARELGWAMEDDEPLLEACAVEQRALVTNNVAHFVVIARQWTEAGRRHSGLIFTSDRSMPRGRAAIGTYVSALATLLLQHPADGALRDQIWWLRPSEPS